MGVGGAEMLVARMIARAPEGVKYSVALLDQIGPLGERVAESEIEVHCVRRRPGIDLAIIGRLKSIYQQLKPDLLHCHQYTPWFYGGWAAARAGLPVVFTEHGRHQPDHRRLRRVLFNRYLLRNTKAITAVSESIREALLRNEMLPTKRVEVVYNGVDHQSLQRDDLVRDRVRSELGIGPQTLVIGHAGRLMPVKNQALLLRSLAAVARQRPDLDWVAVLVGGGPLESDLRALSADLKLQDRVQFLGQRSDVADLLCAFDVFALSSFSEGTSVTLLEAMACSLPVVTTAVGGNPELVQDGVHGYLVPSDDSEAFALALLRLTDADLRARMGAASRLEVEMRFTQQGMIAGYLAIYRRVLNGDRVRQ